MDAKALFKISHGVYLTGAVDGKGRLIGSCVDAVMVVEADPGQIMISLGKKSYTCENIRSGKKFTLSVLPDNASKELISLFGTRSSRDTDKWENVPRRLIDEMPVYADAVAFMVLKTVSIQETATHYVFLADVVSVSVGGSGEKPLLYADYQQRKTEDASAVKRECKICGYVYDGKIPFDELPDDWACPLCGSPKSAFEMQRG